MTPVDSAPSMRLRRPRAAKSGSNMTCRASSGPMNRTYHGLRTRTFLGHRTRTAEGSGNTVTPAERRGQTSTGTHVNYTSVAAQPMVFGWRNILGLKN